MTERVHALPERTSRCWISCYLALPALSLQLRALMPYRPYEAVSGVQTTVVLVRVSTLAPCGLFEREFVVLVSVWTLVVHSLVDFGGLWDCEP